jgi:hypothetical protein
MNSRSTLAVLTFVSSAFKECKKILSVVSLLYRNPRLWSSVILCAYWTEFREKAVVLNWGQLRLSVSSPRLWTGTITDSFHCWDIHSVFQIQLVSLWSLNLTLHLLSEAVLPGFDQCMRFTLFQLCNSILFTKCYWGGQSRAETGTIPHERKTW